MTMMLTQ